MWQEMVKPFRRMPRGAVAAAIFVALAAALPRVSAAEMGTLILDGGGTGNYEVFDRIAAGVAPGERLCLIDTATADGADPRAFFDDYVGLDVALIRVDRDSVARPETAQALRGCGGFFFNGGDPQALSQAFLGGGEGSGALDTVRELVAQRGVMFSGSSAGAMIVGPLTLCECSAQSSVAALTEDKLFQAPGFDLVNGILVDAHFFARGLLGRHLFALARNGIRAGIGIDESTAVVVPRGGGMWEVVGEGTVALIYAPRDARTEKLTGFSLSLLSPGDFFDPATGGIRVADARQPMPLRREQLAPLVFQDAFAPDRVRAVVEQLVRAPGAGATAFAGAGGIRVTFDKTERTKAFSDGRTFTVLGLRVSIDRS